MNEWAYLRLIKEWMNEWMNELICNQSRNEWTYLQSIKEWVNEWMNLSSLIKEWVNEWMNNEYKNRHRQLDIDKVRERESDGYTSKLSKNEIQQPNKYNKRYLSVFEKTLQTTLW